MSFVSFAIICLFSYLSIAFYSFLNLNINLKQLVLYILKEVVCNSGLYAFYNETNTTHLIYNRNSPELSLLPIIKSEMKIYVIYLCPPAFVDIEAKVKSLSIICFGNLFFLFW